MLPVNTLELSVFVSTPHGQWTNRLYYEPASALPADTDMIAVANAFFTLLQPKYTPILCATAAFAGIKARYVSATVDIEGYSTSAAVNGDVDDSGILPDQDCLEIRRLTAKPGRDNRGRIFISGIPETIQTDGLLATGFYTATQDLASSLGADVTGGVATFHARHWNRKTNTMVVVTQCRPLVRLVSRRDRAKRLPYQSI